MLLAISRCSIFLISFYLEDLTGMEEKAEHKSGYKSIVHGQVVEEHRLAGAGCNGRPSAAGRQQEFWPGLLCGKNCCARSNLLERTSLSAVY